MKGLKYTIYSLSVLSFVGIVYQIWNYFPQISPGYREFMFDIKSPVAAFEMPAGQIVLCVIGVLIFLFGAVVYLCNMSSYGYRPIQLSHLLLTLLGCAMTFGLYYGAIVFAGKGFSETGIAIKVLQIIGCVLLVADLIYLLASKTLRAIPLWILYVLFGYVISVLAIAILKIVLTLLAIGLIALVMLGSGRKKRIVDKDGTVYEEI